MRSLHVVSDLDECRRIWKQAMPAEVIGDLWEVRECFQRHFRYRPHFIVAEDDRGPCGLLPLSWIEEQHCYGYFPGETWQGKTWLEQNKIICTGDTTLGDLLSGADLSSYHLRYLVEGAGLTEENSAVDEVGYLFLPPRYDYDISNYFGEFSRKSFKNIRKDRMAIENLGVAYRYDDFSDFEHMVRLNRERFGEYSYFHDPRFLEGFRSLAGFLREEGWLRMTTVLIEGEPAAVDMGCIYRNAYTLLGGGTDGRYPGVAKLINLHHMERACRERLDQVDFLCGDFNWKKLFHLTPRPLFLLAKKQAIAA